MSTAGQTTTVPDVDTAVSTWEVALRVVTIAAVVGLVLATGLGFLGVRTAESSVSGHGYEMTVTHAAMTRPGLATPFSLEVQTTNGAPLPEEVTIRISAEYLAIFDDNGMEPLPSESFNTDEWTWWTFTVPDGRQRLTIDLDARLEPAVQSGRTAEAALQLGDDRVLSVEFTTGVSP